MHNGIFVISSNVLEKFKPRLVFQKNSKDAGPGAKLKEIRACFPLPGIWAAEGLGKG